MQVCLRHCLWLLVSKDSLTLLTPFGESIYSTYFSLAGKDQILKDHRGREFVIGFPKQFRSSGSLDIYIASRELSTANITADEYFESFSLEPNIVTHVSLPKRLLMSQGKESKGILIESDSEIAVYGLNQIERTTDAFLGLPVDILGTRYLAVGSEPSSNIGIQYLNVLSIIATEDNTTVTISPRSRLLIGRQGFRRIYHPYGRPLVFKLNKLESYTIRSVSDITGSLIESDKAISVISGHECAYVPDPFRYCDHLIEQVLFLYIYLLDDSDIIIFFIIFSQL